MLMDGENVVTPFIEILQDEADKIFTEYISDPLRQPILDELSNEERRNW